jgi:hypothetical protein
LEEKALAILAQEGRTIESYYVHELNALLGWHQAECPTGVSWKKEDKVAQWRQIAASLKPPPLYTRWTEQDEERLVGLAEDGVDIGDTAHGRELALRQRELEAAAETMSREKRDALMRMWAEMDAEEALSALATDTASDATKVDS